ncbi:MAG: hypothetical protein GDA38_26655 [Hormoscilla sp. SP12CHS1]|nr:hypothetical protein [Hormoscilla sp. SP12CHS1]
MNDYLLSTNDYFGQPTRAGQLLRQLAQLLEKQRQKALTFSERLQRLSLVADLSISGKIILNLT